MGYAEEHLSCERAEAYDAGFETGYDGFVWRELEIPLLRRALSGTQSGRHADLACGTGRLSSELAGLRDQVTGYDVSEAMISHARANSVSLGNVDFRVLDLTLINQLERSCSSITAFRLFLNADREICKSVASVAFASLESDGVFVSNIHCVTGSPVSALYAVDAIARKIVGKSRHRLRNSRSIADISELLTRAGFVDLKIVRYGYFPRIPWLADRVPAAILRLSERIGSKFFATHGSQFALIIAKRE